MTPYAFCLTDLPFGRNVLSLSPSTSLVPENRLQSDLKLATGTEAVKGSGMNCILRRRQPLCNSTVVSRVTDVSAQNWQKGTILILTSIKKSRFPFGTKPS
jgi:hypothetical protein